MPRLMRVGGAAHGVQSVKAAVAILALAVYGLEAASAPRRAAADAEAQQYAEIKQAEAKAATGESEVFPPGMVVELSNVKWDYVRGHDCFGHNLNTISVIGWGDEGSPADRKRCATMCSQMPKCVAFNYPVLTNGAWDAIVRGPRVCYFKHGYLLSQQLHVRCSSELNISSWDYYTLLSEEAKQKLQKEASAEVDEDGPVGNFDGMWTQESQPGAEVIKISSGTIRWSANQKAKITEQTSTGLKTDLDDSKHYMATRSPDGRSMDESGKELDTLTWNGGDVWIRVGGKHYSAETAANSSGLALSLATTSLLPPSAPPSPPPTEKAANSYGLALSLATTSLLPPSAPPSPPNEDEQAVISLLEESLVKINGLWTDKEDPGTRLYAIDVRNELGWRHDNGTVAFSNTTQAVVTGSTTKFSMKFTTSLAPAVGGHLTDAGELELADGSTWIRYDAPASIFEGDASGPSGDASGLKADMTMPISMGVGMDSVSSRVCEEANITYEPLDMTGEFYTKEDNSTMCKQRCARVKECAHYAYWIPQGDCHIQDVYSVRTTDRIGFRSGLPGCTVAGGKALVENSMIIQQTGACFHQNGSYTPLDSIRLSQDPLNQTQFRTVLDCQKGCAARSWCAGFTYNALAQTCHLADQHAKVGGQFAYTVAGPPHCRSTATFSFVINNISYPKLLQKNAIEDFKACIQYGMGHVQQLQAGIENASSAELMKALEKGTLVEPLSSAEVDLEGNSTQTIAHVKLNFENEDAATTVQNLLLKNQGYLMYTVLMSLKAKFDGSQQIAVGVVSLGDISGLALGPRPDFFANNFKDLVLALVKKYPEGRAQPSGGWLPCLLAAGVLSGFAAMMIPAARRRLRPGPGRRDLQVWLGGWGAAHRPLNQDLESMAGCLPEDDRLVA